MKDLSDSRVCSRCASIKQACDGGTPCGRCQRLSLPCQGQCFSGDRPQVKARIRRVHTGCSSCKRRKRKCDERRPKCGDCQRLCLQCLWPVSMSPAERRRPSPNHSLQLESPSAPSMADSNAQHQIWHTRAQSSSQGNLVVAHSLSICSWDDTESIAGMATVDNQMNDTSKDPESTSVAPDSTRNALLDIWQQHNIVSPDENDALSSSSSPLSSWINTTPAGNSSPAESDASLVLSIPSTPSVLPSLSRSEDRSLLNHYIHVTSKTLCRQKCAANPYVDYILPMAYADDTVLYALLALSASQWRGTQPQLANRALAYQGTATRRLANSLATLDPGSADVALLSCLLLCMVDLYDGTAASWEHHLQGARRILQASDVSEKQQGHCVKRTFYRRLFRYLCSAVTASTCKPPLSQAEDGREGPVAVGLASCDVSNEDAAIYGLPKQLFHLLDRVNGLAHLRKTRIDGGSELAFQQTATQVQADIDHWSLEYGGLLPAVNRLTEGSDESLHAATAFEWALRLRLHQIVNGYAITEDIVKQALSHILDSVQKIRYGSTQESCLVFPLVMAGGVCTSSEDRLIIQDRLVVMEKTCGFGQVANARELVERVWKTRDANGNSSDTVNWARIRYYEMRGLAVF